MFRDSKTRDWLAVLTIIIIIPGVWIAQAMGILNVSGPVEGATIMAWGLILQFYFRKKPKSTTGS